MKIEPHKSLDFRHLYFLFRNYRHEALLDYLKTPYILTGSGRASLRIVLEYLKHKQILTNRTDEILIPKWLCQSVVYTINRFASPSYEINSRTKAVFAYHQYGYPQRMDIISAHAKELGLLVLEDCANVYKGYCKDLPLGSIGYASIFSFSKMFPSFGGGAVASSDPGLIQFAEKRLNDSQHSLLTYSASILNELCKNTSLSRVATDWQEMSYAMTDRAFKIRDTSVQIISDEIAKKAIDKRIILYDYLVSSFSDRPQYFDGLERKGIVPYVVPLFAEEQHLQKICEKLRSNQIDTGIYHFDVNRNVICPDFRKCVWIPIHQGLNEQDLEKICKLIREV